jgi:hypothetical protein
MALPAPAKADLIVHHGHENRVKSSTAAPGLFSIPARIGHNRLVRGVAFFRLERGRHVAANTPTDAYMRAFPGDGDAMHRLRQPDEAGGLGAS